MLIGIVLISIGIRLLFSFSSQTFPDKIFTTSYQLSLDFLSKNNLSLSQGIYLVIRKNINKYPVFEFVLFSLFDGLISLLLYLQLIKLSSFIPANRYRFFQILIVLTVCLTTCNNMYMYYVPNIISHFEIIFFMLYIEALLNQHVFFSNILFFMLTTLKTQFLSLTIPQFFLCFFWLFQKPFQKRMVFMKIFLTFLIIQTIIIVEYLLYDQITLKSIYSFVFPNILSRFKDSEEHQCILQPNTYVLLRSCIQILKFAYYNIFIVFPGCIKAYYENEYSFTFWQILTFSLFQLPIIILLIKNQDIYNKEQQHTLTPLFYVVLSILSYHFSLYKSNQSMLFLVYYVILILYFHQKINISLNYSQTKLNKKPLVKIRKNSSRKKLCIKAENDHLKSPSSLYVIDFDDIYQFCKTCDVIQAVSKQQLNKINTQISKNYRQYEELQFGIETNELVNKYQQLKLRFRNYIDTISVQSIGLCLQLSGLVATFQITYDLISSNTTIFIKFGMELVWKTLLMQSDQLFTKLIFNQSIILIQFVEDLIAFFLLKDHHNIVGYALHSINFGILLFIYICCLLTLISRANGE